MFAAKVTGTDIMIDIKGSVVSCVCVRVVGLRLLSSWAPCFLAQGFSTIQRRQYVWGEDEEDEEGLGEICTVNQGNYRLIGYRLIDKS